MIRNWRPLALVSQRSGQLNVFKTLYCSTVPNCATTSEENSVNTKDVKLENVLEKYSNKKHINLSNTVTILSDIVKQNPVDASSILTKTIKDFEGGQKDNSIQGKIVYALSNNIPEDFGIKPLVS